MKVKAANVNGILNDVLYGPLGWKLACAVLGLVVILVFVAVMDGPWSRGTKTAIRPPPQQDAEGPSADLSSPKQEEREG